MIVLGESELNWRSEILLSVRRIRTADIKEGDGEVVIQGRH
jgi:hypothetical protein